MKQIIYILIALMLVVIPVHGYYDYSTDDEILYLYDNNDESIGMKDGIIDQGISHNPNKTICVNSTCIAGWCDNYCREAYDLDYTFTFRISETEYKTVIVTVEQVIISDTWFTNVVNRKLYMDGHEILHKNNVKISKYLFPKAFHFSFVFEDSTVTLDDQENTNQTLVFTELDMTDQHLLLCESHDNSVTWHFNTLPDESAPGTELKGLLGIMYNVVERVPKVGSSIQNIIFLPLFLIQMLIDFSGTAIMILITDWYYIIMLIEVICMAKALRTNDDIYNIAKEYLVTHVVIYMYIKDKLVMPFITLILKIVVIIRNMFRI